MTALALKPDEQMERFKTYVRSLNEQFARWVVQQWETKSDKFWSHGMVDYLRHAVIIKRDHPDAAALLDQNGKSENPERKHEAQLTILPLQHSKACTLSSCDPTSAKAMADVACVNAQTVHFVRHGEGFHNIGIVNLDAHLTEAGWRQAEALNKHVAGLKPALDIQARPDRYNIVVIVSPLIRALETAAGAFGAGPFKGSGRPLMLAQSGEPDECAAHCAVACPEGIPFIAFEGCRERLGSAVCDKRRDIAFAEEQFPGIDFSHIERGADVVYDQHKVESEHAVMERGARFLQWLMARPESRIAVVSHCGFIFLTLSAFGHECAHSVQEEMHRGFDNCEMRSMIITDAAGGGRFNNSWFPGGRDRCGGQQRQNSSAGVPVCCGFRKLLSDLVGKLEEAGGIGRAVDAVCTHGGFRAAAGKLRLERCKLVWIAPGPCAAAEDDRGQSGTQATIATATPLP
ncbi:phosphoglycerate mutase-like protein [Coccomyxa subellipsoidea C-169]|uniref:Phosphoglycerate mutase-like protein n=1 Tax=Coccomyxa subellipsoidea (strain C-169) TaxID=574566 RepID=I0Z1B9_COCSC|nr:phosphoglycerate mutase-like protein [Coccomyxa subellipsoidea C-169]EIE24438.1 phosphoglycerate mutase-like protein [Coccomyxa subellipsoidea C-169]|eukprot:XP_005648982.1 phosphoglycerate mutase-like protein [Coccomyxa subellipsoidea C-169]